MLKTENGRLSTWVYVDVRGRDLASVVDDLRAAVAKDVKLTPGVSIAWSGQFEHLERAPERLKFVIPDHPAIIFVLLFMTFYPPDDAGLLMGTHPLLTPGCLWLLYPLYSL